MFTTLETETREYVTTKIAAHYLNRAAGTLRQWACKSDRYISSSKILQPKKIGGKLLWSVSDIRYFNENIRDKNTKMTTST